jgi:hypothetical protein
MEGLWIITILLCWIIVLWCITYIGNTYQRAYYQHQTQQIEIEGIYMNEDNSQRSVLHKENNHYRHHKQNTSNVVDIFWEEVKQPCVCNQKQCVCPKQLRDLSNDYKKAIVSISSIDIYEDDTHIETLHRSTIMCPISATPPPSKSTLHLYEIVTIVEEQREELIPLLNSKRVCASQNDWNLTVTSFLVRGFFIIDTAGTCFYTVSNDQMEVILLWKEEIVPRVISIDELRDRTFLGSMI